ncbi:hypothetical protein JCGZ_12339 [Jatropha curcas]|uniref:RPW8 domain-containing protein n=1 Tax=Jatropha curcas TaxID=180498 RepID=A0A067KA67_JATCU|nr:hypothetical protein JCGZ_12339 [Jatropha curcas]
MGVFEEACLGAVLGALLQAIIAAKERADFFKKTLEHLETTVKNVETIIREILKLENVPADVKKWKLLKKRKVKKLILEVVASLERFMKYDFQAEQLRYVAIVDKDTAEVDKEIAEITEKWIM